MTGRTLLLLATMLWAACSGPAAGDAAICRDVIARLCAAPRCAQVDTALGVTDACQTELLTRTGCTTDDFGFTTPSRERVLNCRLPLLRSGGASTAHPDCLDVGDVVSACPDVVSFLNGVPP